MSVDRLIEAIRSKENPTVAGLDPKLSYVPEYLRKEAFDAFGKNPEGAAEALWLFNKGLIDALCDIVPAVKPQSAYYEALGWQGARVLDRTIRYARARGLYVITDVKRGDIGSTAEAYALAYLGTGDIEGNAYEAYNSDAATVNAYLGSDGVKPFVKACAQFDKMIFTLVKTSNPSSSEFQDLASGGHTVFETVGLTAEKWGAELIGRYGYSAVGAVVGATHPAELTSLRAMLPHTFFLVPGYGAQGAGAADVAGAFDKNGDGAIVNSSRGIMCAWQKTGNNGEDFAEAARNAAISMRDALRAVYR